MSAENLDIEQTLVGRARKGDQQSMHQLYKMYVRAMYNVSIRIVANQLDAEDILQESFADAFGKLGAFKGESSFGAWLKRIVINKSINHVKKQKIRFAEMELLPETEDIPDEDDSPGDSIFAKILPEMIHEAIKTLPGKAKAVLSLYLLEGYQHKEIARMLDISESTSKSQFQRARTLLQERLLKMIGKTL
ncbi:MAG: RNA polymerase sigma factor [Tannerella sp.]|nr:RNA polymerase sigma factor [Tannerella sp.]